MSGPLFADNAWGQTSTSVATTDTTITLQTGQGANFPLIASGSGNWFYIFLITSANVLECVKVTATAGDTFTVVRNAGIPALPASLAFAASTRVELRSCAAMLSDMSAATATVQTNLNAGIAALLGALNTIFTGNAAGNPTAGGGIICFWKGSIASIPAGWSLCDGRTVNGVVTPNLVGYFAVGAAASGVPTPGSTGGSTTATLSLSNLPSHNHGISDPGHNHSLVQTPHSHGFSDPGHVHGVADSGHTHVVPIATWSQGGGNAGYLGPGAGGSGSGQNWATTVSATGIGIDLAGTNASIQAQYANASNDPSGTGISILDAGANGAFSILPPYYALAYIMFTGALS